MRPFLSIFLLLASLTSAWGQEPVIRLLEGRLKLQLGTEARFLTHNDPQNPLEVKLLVGEQMQTGVGTQAEVSLRGGEEIIKMRSGTLLTVSTLDEQATKLFMPVGDAQFEVDPNRAIKRLFQVQTNTSIASVTGTRFSLKAAAKKIGQAAKTGMITIAGKVGLAPVSAPNVQVEVNAGEASQVEEGKAPTAPISVPPEVLASVDEGGGGDALDTMTFPPAPDLDAAGDQQQASGGGEADGGGQPEEPTIALDEIIESVGDAVGDAAEASVAGALPKITVYEEE
ncbi:MAG: FecR domain-containing protein [Bordetella sp.]